MQIQFKCEVFCLIFVRFFSGPCFPAFELSMEIYSADLRFQYGKYGPENSLFGQLSHIASYSQISIFGRNMGKYGTEKFRIKTDLYTWVKP